MLCMIEKIRVTRNKKEVVVKEIKQLFDDHKKLTYDGIMNFLDKKDMIIEPYLIRKYVSEMVETGSYSKTGTKPIFFSKKEV